MKVLILNGSPKSVSDTFKLTEAFQKGLNENSEHEVNVVNVIEKNINPCLGCFKCWETGDGNCIQQDDQNEILRLYCDSDIIIWSFPLYCYAMPSHLKAVLDRTIPLIKMKMVEVNGRIQHVPLVDFSRKHTLVICGCGFPDWEGNFEGLRIMCENSFGNLTTVFVPEAPLLNLDIAKPVADPLLERFAEAGREYVRELNLSADTIASLEKPMISKEDYLKGINS